MSPALNTSSSGLIDSSLKRLRHGAERSRRVEVDELERALDLVARSDVEGGDLREAFLEMRHALRGRQNVALGQRAAFVFRVGQEERAEAARSG